MSAFLRCGNTAAFNASILVVSNLRHDLSGIAIIEQLASDDVLDGAYEWLCRRRRDYSANFDVWALRRCWRSTPTRHSSAGSSAARLSWLSFQSSRAVVAAKTIANFIEYEKSAAPFGPSLRLRCTSAMVVVGRERVV
jgi:hypothetical protein